MRVRLAIRFIISEKECKAANIDYLAAKHPFSDHGKSMCLGETHGHVKILCDPVSGEVFTEIKPPACCTLSKALLSTTIRSNWDLELEWIIEE